ncbi:YkgJ family cysteine cluster protein [Candidatus Lokiarchaeum ossiferum]|uniref:YkgJ family cysteine cluster protein n=1 Tax=Candidatus Lokiarchaeum ossiferum TaxID=2951803 RepID=UPI00352FAF4E
MDCTGCDRRCCKAYYIPLYPEEYEKLLKIKPDLETTEVGYFQYINPPCPFLVHDKCAVYNIRPIECRGFPINFGTTDGFFISLWLDGICPNRKHVNTMDLIKTLYITGQNIRLRLEMQSVDGGVKYHQEIIEFEENFLYKEHDRLQAAFESDFSDKVSSVPINADLITQFLHLPLYTESELEKKIKYYTPSQLQLYTDMLAELKKRSHCI